MRVTGWRCAVCSAELDVAAPFPWRCPNSTSHDRRHLLQIVQSAAESAAESVPAIGQLNPYLRHDGDLAWAAYADANGMGVEARRRLVVELDDAVSAVAGVGFVPTPFARSAVLSDALGFDVDGGVWVKDETGAVAGSQKARHLFTILLHLPRGGDDRPSHRAAAARHRIVWQRRPRSGHVGACVRVADRRVRAHVDERWLR